MIWWSAVTNSILWNIWLNKTKMVKDQVLAGKIWKLIFWTSVGKRINFSVSIYWWSTEAYSELYSGVFTKKPQLKYFRGSLNTPLKFAIFLNSSVLEAFTRRCSIKKVFLEILQNSQESIYTRVSFLIKLQDSACNFIKNETGAQVFLWIFKKNLTELLSYRTPPAAVTAVLHGVVLTLRRTK